MAYNWLVLALLLQGAAAPPATQSVSVAVPGTPVDLTVEWLRIDAGLAGGVAVTSTQTFPAGRPVTLGVTTGADRYLRFSRPNAAPVTVSVADVTAAKSYALPETESGGELVVAFETDGIIPSSLRLSGPRTTIRDRRSRAVMAIGGLPAGIYDLEPAYSSGMSGARTAVTIEAGRSTMLIQKRESVGGLRISAAPETCSAAGDVVVSMDGPPMPTRGGAPILPNVPLPPGRASGAGPVSIISGIPRYTLTSYRTATGCDRLIEGLPAGRYTVSFNAQAGGTVGSVVVDVAPQQLANAFVPAPPVQLSGTVLFNGKPATGATLSFLGRTPTGSALPRVPVAADGRYTVSLPASGDYTMTASFSETGGLGPHRTTLRLIDGKNTYDWNLTGGTITVLITGWDRRTPLRLSIIGTGMQSMSTYDGATFPIRLVGLPPGGYTVSASIMGIAAARESKTVTIDATNTEVTVSLEMVANTNVLRVKDDTGAPVAGLTISGLPIGRLVETSPGTYSLADVPPGTDLELASARRVRRHLQHHHYRRGQ